MLVDKNFIFISLPRCASTSFMITCLKNKISIEHFNSVIEINDDFKEKYDILYKEFEQRKINKTLV